MKQILVEVCVGTSCHLLGAQDLFQTLENLPIEKQELLQVQGVTCLKSCGRGPNVRIQQQVYTNITPDRLLEIIETLLSSEEALANGASN